MNGHKTRKCRENINIKSIKTEKELGDRIRKQKDEVEEIKGREKMALSSGMELAPDGAGNREKYWRERRMNDETWKMINW